MAQFPEHVGKNTTLDEEFGLVSLVTGDVVSEGDELGVTQPAGAKMQLQVPFFGHPGPDPAHATFFMRKNLLVYMVSIGQ